jgi:Domain of unknown function (DUF4956)
MTGTQVRRRTNAFARMVASIPLRVAIYYLVIGAIAVAAWRWVATTPLAGLLGLPSAGPEPDIARSPAYAAFSAIVAIFVAALLAFPVAWVYTYTHERRGYRQSVVHMMVLLPVVVAGVVVLVKDSLALAFSLAGIVAAVRFRNTLDDSKDAVYVFLATAIGLAAGVNVLVAAVLSVLFNGIILALWGTDFARTPARTAQRDARRRLERALATANRTGEFIARLDADVLSKLPPAQLEALADRAWRRRKRAAPELDGLGKDGDTLLRLRTKDVPGLRSLIEPILDARAKRVRYGGVVHEANGVDWIEYRLRVKRSETPDTLLAALRDAGGGLVDDAEVRR